MLDLMWYLPCCVMLGGLFWLAGWAIPEVLFRDRPRSRLERVLIAITFGSLLLPLPLYFAWQVLPAGAALLLALAVCAGGGWLLRRWRQPEVASEVAPTSGVAAGAAATSPPASSRIPIAILGLAMLWALGEGTTLLQIGETGNCAFFDYPKHMAVSWSLAHYGLPFKNPWWAVPEARQGAYYMFSYLPHSALWSVVDGRGADLSAWLAARAAVACVGCIVAILLLAQRCGVSRLGLWFGLMILTFAGDIRLLFLPLRDEPDLAHLAWRFGPQVLGWSQWYHWVPQHTAAFTIYVAVLAAAPQRTKAKFIVIPALLGALAGTSVFVAMTAPFLVLCLLAFNWQDGYTERLGQRLRVWAIPLIGALVLGGLVALAYRAPGAERGFPFGFQFPDWYPFFARLDLLFNERLLPPYLIPSFWLLSPFVWGVIAIGFAFATGLYGLVRARRERVRLPVMLQAITLGAALSFMIAQSVTYTGPYDELFRRVIMPFVLGATLWGMVGAQWALERFRWPWQATRWADRAKALWYLGGATLLALGAATTGWELYHFGLRTPAAYRQMHTAASPARVAAWRFVREHTLKDAHIFLNMELEGPHLAQYYCQRQMVLAGKIERTIVFIQNVSEIVQRDYDWLAQVAANPSAEQTARALRSAGADYVVVGLDEVRPLQGTERTVPYWGNAERFRDERFFSVEYEADGYLVVRVKTQNSGV